MLVSMNRKNPREPAPFQVVVLPAQPTYWSHATASAWYRLVLLACLLAMALAGCGERDLQLDRSLPEGTLIHGDADGARTILHQFEQLTDTPVAEFAADIQRPLQLCSGTFDTSSPQFALGASCALAPSAPRATAPLVPVLAPRPVVTLVALWKVSRARAMARQVGNAGNRPRTGGPFRPGSPPPPGRS